MKERNILITTLGNTFNHDQHHYFSYEDNGSYKYCEGISTAEAGAKYVLSTVRIDKILVLGPPSAVGDENANEDIKLRDLCSFGAELPSVYSEYKFFCYRIMQYLNHVDIEGTDIYMNIEPEEKKEILDALHAGSKDYSKNEFFHTCNQDLDLYKEIFKKIPNPNKEKERWLRHYLFMRLQDTYKLNTLYTNEHIKVRFIPTLKKGDSNLKMGNLPNILNHVLGGNNAKVNLYVDLQGFDIVDSHTFLNVLFMLQNNQTGMLNIQQIITTTVNPLLFTSPIENQKSRLELSELLSGIDSFLRYGKVNAISNYWKSRNLHDIHIERIINAMEIVDLGITLCNISQLELGIQMLRDSFKKRRKPGMTLETTIFTILEDRIRDDYGKLLEGEELDVLELVKWAIRKQLYQQALTIIESRIPHDFVRNGILYYARNEQDKNVFLEVFNQLYWKAFPKDRYQFNAVDHYFIKFYRRQKVYQKGATDIITDFAKLRLKDMSNPDLKLKTFTAFQGDLSKLEELYIAYLRIGDMRNQISHAMDISSDITNLKEVIALLDTTIQHFVSIYEDVKKELDPTQKPICVSNSEFETYHMEHPISRNKKKQED
ncbi:MAG: TM1812 family CRISPR-associated protein [Bacillota bacterium]|nr:TM1812 family CRISPR-associated protein [Bacillota bacterium]